MANGCKEATEETWERLRPTIERIVMYRRCTVAAAQMALIEACAQGRIRALWLGYYDSPCPLIPKMDWIGADIDLHNDRVIKANGERMAYVGFSRDDLEGWLVSSDLPGRPPVRADELPRRPASKEEIREEMRAVYVEVTKPPNLKEVPKHVQPRLLKRGVEASERFIAEIAAEPEFANLRRKPGKTLASERAK
jgi:hypothetical protein